MRFLLSIFIIFGLALSVCVFQEAQAAEDDSIILDEEDDLIILDEDAQPQADTSPIVDFIQRHFGIAGGGFYAGAGGDGTFEQGFGFGSARFDYPFTLFSRKGRLFVAGGYSYRQVELTLEFEEGSPTLDNDAAFVDRRRELQGLGDPEDPEDAEESDCPFAPIADPTDDQVRELRRTCEFQVKVTDSAAELREAFLEYEIIPDLVVSVGRQRPVWGQFDVFSVTNALLPLEFQSREFGFSNNNLGYPQDVVIVSYFPTERIEVSGYLFLQTTLDPVLENGLKGGGYTLLVDEESCEALDPDICDDLEDESSFLEVDLPFSGDLEGTDKLNYAARAIWRLDDLTLGFTFNYGRSALFGAFNRLPSVERFCPDMTDADCINNPVGYNVRERLIVGRATSFGAEISIPINQWTLKAELVYIQEQADIGVRTEMSRPSCPSEDMDCLESQDELFDWIIDTNGGRGYVDVDMLMGQFGVDVRYDRWNFGLGVIFFQTFPSSDADRANDLYKAAFPGDDSPLDSSSFEGIPFPTAYVFYDLGVDKEHTIGFAGGFLGVVAGVSVFYTGSKLFNEHVSWTASVDYTTSLTKLLIGEANGTDDERDGGGDTELAEDFSLTFRIGATLEF